MKRFLPVLALATTTVAMPALAADVGVSVSIGQPGFYGHIDIGNVPPPPVVYAQPVIIQPVPVGVVYQPIYVHAPPVHVQNWAMHCGQYGACGRPVYFVQSNWYNEVYVPEYQKRHGGPKHKHGGWNNGRGKGHRD